MTTSRKNTGNNGYTAFTTDGNATVTQGFLYAPFGEITTEYAPLWQNGVMPKYTFNAKELDEETGMYYYEARYMAPPTFISRDPLFEKYFWLSPYAYCANNPMKYVDPSGEEICVMDENGNKYRYFQNENGKWNLYSNVEGEYKGGSKFLDNTLADLDNIRATSQKDAELQDRFNHMVASESKYLISERNGKISHFGTPLEKGYCGQIYFATGEKTIDERRSSLVHELLGHAYSKDKGTFDANFIEKITVGKYETNREQLNAIDVENRYRYASGMKEPRTQDLSNKNGVYYDVSYHLDQKILGQWKK